MDEFSVKYFYISVRQNGGQFVSYPKQISVVICCLSRLDLNLCSLRLQLVAAMGFGV